MFVHSIDPIFLSIGSFEIRYYSLFYMLGFILGYFMVSYLAKKRHVPLTKDDLSDMLLYALLGVIIGARTFYVLFYNLPFFIDNPDQIFALWNGGLSFHGGAVGMFIAALLFCRKKKIHFYDLADLIVIPGALALALGRLGNFMNGELYGRVTNVPWAMKFQGAEGYRHPSQLYACFKNLTIFTILWIVKDKPFPRGFILWLFVMLYASFRFTVEFFRQPDPQLGFIIGFLTMGQLLSMAMFIVGGFFMWTVLRKKDK